MRAFGRVLLVISASVASTVTVASPYHPALAANTAAAVPAQIAYAKPATVPSGFANDSLLGIVGVDGSSNHGVATQEAAGEPAWNPTGTLLAFSAVAPDGGRSVHIIDPTTGVERAVTPIGWHTPVWSPDGTSLAVVSDRFISEDLGVVSAAGGSPKVVISHSQGGADAAVTGRPAWSPDGSKLAAVLTPYSEGDQGGSLLATVNANGSGYHLLTTDSATLVPTSYEQVAWSPDGSRLIYDWDNGGEANTEAVFSINADGNGGGPLTDGFADIGGFSADGTAVVLAIDGSVDVFSMTTGATTALHHPPAGSVDSRPIFAPTSGQVVFCETDHAGASNLWSVRSDGSSATQLTTSGLACDPSVASHAVRYAGATRVETAISASRATYASAQAIVVARDDVYADALAAGPLAAKVGGPLLLTPPTATASALQAEVTRLRATTAYVVGDTTAVSTAAENGLRAAGITTVHRIGGATRYDTAALIAEQIGGTQVYVVRGDNWPDAASVSALAAFQQRPILLTPQDSLAPAALAALKVLNASNAVIVGGTAAVSTAAELQLTNAHVVTSRLAGSDRWATSAAVATAALSAGMTGNTWLANGLNWPDAIGAGPAVAVQKGVLVLVAPTTLDSSPPTRDWIAAHPSQTIVAVGGPDVVSAVDVAAAVH
jgi:putative cell wall-binding protein/Tol biopolymer transport system component